MQVSDREFRAVSRKVGKRIQQLRKTMGFTQAQLEELTGLSDIGVHERGEKNPTLLTLLRFSKSLKVELKHILDISGDSEDDKLRAEVTGLLARHKRDRQRKALEILRLFLSS